MKRLFPLLVLLACAHAPLVDGAEPALTFRKNGATVATFSRSALEALAPVETISGFDPYYQRTKRWRAVELSRVLAAAFPGEPLASREFVLRAIDGYTVPMRGERLLEKGAWLALADAEGAWQPIGPMRANPAPFYLVWQGAEQTDSELYPRPWALASISVEPFEAVFPKVLPPDGASATVQHGFELYKSLCFRCHALNQQGGRVGPELNVPKNITEYRDAGFLRAWIRNPQSYRPSVMPPFAGLAEADLDALLAYLGAMKEKKEGP